MQMGVEEVCADAMDTPTKFIVKLRLLKKGKSNERQDWFQCIWFVRFWVFLCEHDILRSTTYSSFMMEPPERIRILTQNWRLLSSQISSEAIVDFSHVSLISTSSWFVVAPVVRTMVAVGAKTLPEMATAQFLSNSSTMKLRPLPTLYLSIILSVIVFWKSVSKDWKSISQLPSWAVVDDATIEITIHIMIMMFVKNIIFFDGSKSWLD